MPLIETKGAASAQGFGEFATSSEKLYIESCFSTYLYTGNGSTQTITNGIDLAGEGGLVWIKNRDSALNHVLFDTVRGNTSGLFTNTTAAAANPYYTWSANRETFDSFNSNGFSVTQYPAGGGSDSYINWTGKRYSSFTFRRAPKFFDIVTYTGNGASNRQIAHELGSVPGCIIVKRTDTAADWQVYHRSLANTEYLVLNSTAAKATGTTRWNSTTPTSTEFSLGTDTTVNANGGTYVAYIFAHDAGGFGLSGTDNVISCGSFTTNGVNGSFSVTTGYEPQWWLVKNTSRPGDWHLVDIMRGATASATGRELFPNLSSAETSNYFVTPTATGFYGTAYDFGGADTYIYIAIRRGPMKTPTSGTSVFAPVKQAGGGTVTTNFPVDLALNTKPTSAFSRYSVDRLRGSSQTTFPYLTTESTDAEVAGSGYGFGFDNNTGYKDNGVYGGIETPIYWNFRRAPGFFDVVSYQGSGVAGRAINHNLGVAPELMIVKSRSSSATNWVVGATSIGVNNNVFLNATSAALNFGATYFFNTAPTSSVFYVGNDTNVNAGVPTYVAYLFATVAGVSKVFSFTGNGSSQTINCGFTAGARFVLIKRTDSTGDWYVWDSARGIVASNDPHLSLNTTAAEVTTDDSVDADSTGFVVNQNSATNVNVNGATYIGLAVA